MKTFLYLIFLSFTSVMISQNTEIFNNANELYSQGKYEEAIEAYENILKTDTYSEALYFNLANAHYKLNHIAESVYYFEKAKLLNPSDADVVNNLSFANQMTVDDIQIVPEVGFDRIYKNIVNLFTVDAWAIITVIAIMLFVVLFLAYHFSYASTKKRFAFIVSGVCLFVFCFSLAMAFQKEALDKKQNPAIVFSQEVRVTSDPNKLSEELFRIHEGTKINVLETFKDWSKIQLQDESIGWINSSEIRLLKDK